MGTWLVEVAVCRVVGMCAYRVGDWGAGDCSWVFGFCVHARLRVCACACVQRDGRTALYTASANGKEEVVEVLVSSGAAVNAATV